MGKPTGFLDYEREDNTSIKPLERIKNFNEFHKMLPEDERKKQGARCMNCGVPFCQSGMILNGMATGCPLHNLIPEWNDGIFHGNFEHAFARLTKTASFPEFTGRVCPALCEAACTCGMEGKSVSVKENELATIEYGYANGLVKPRIPSVRTEKSVAVVGSGPSGLAVADRLNRRGHSVTVFEKNDRIGGLLMYGIPNMKLEKKIVDRRVELMKKEGVTFVTNTDVDEKKAKELMKEFDAIVLCCGAGKPRDLAGKGRENAKGIYFAVDFLTANTKSLLDSDFKDNKFINPKNKNVVIVGGGDTGNDCTGTVIRHGCKSVVSLEMMPKLPETRGENNPWPQWPRVCKTDYGQEEAIAKFGHDPRIYQTTIKEFITDDKGNIKAVQIISLSPEKDPKTGRMMMKEVSGSEKVIDCDLLIIAAGFLGCKEYVPKSFGVEIDARNKVVTEPNHYHTNVDKVFTAGDMHRGQSLVVWGIAEGRACAKEVDEYLMGYTNMI